MTVAHLVRFHNLHAPEAEKLRIVCVESPDVPTVGVGEATVPNLRHTLQYLGIDEREFLLRTQATFKQSIRFEQWSSPGDDGDFFHHPFDGGAQAIFPTLPQHWMATNPDAPASAFARDTSFQHSLCERFRSPRARDDKPYKSSASYAYHMDAALAAEMFREWSCARGAEHVQARVTSVERDQAGWITGLRLDRGGLVAGDLFVDCSGFRSLLLEGEMGVPWRSFQPHLLCDRAVAVRLPERPGRPLPPYTRAIARPHGWTWRIPLFHREGAGYVYSSAHCTPEQAEAALRDWMRVPEDAEVWHLPMRTGCHHQCWEKNCVAIGLAAGFI